MNKILLDGMVAALISLIVLWIALALTLIVMRPDRETMTEAARLPGDVVRLARNLLRDRELPRGARVRLWILFGYLISPIDLVPDFIPVIGYADDVIVTAILLRGTARSIGREMLADAWSGSEDNLSVILRLCGYETAG